jgi:hypothetical protein
VKACVKYNVIYRHQEKYSISEMCRFFEVSRSGYYAYIGRMGKPAKDLPLAEKIRQCQVDSRNTYGYRRVHSLRNDFFGQRLWLKRKNRLANAGAVHWCHHTLDGADRNAVGRKGSFAVNNLGTVRRSQKNRFPLPAPALMTAKAITLHRTQAAALSLWMYGNAGATAPTAALSSNNLLSTICGIFLTFPKWFWIGLPLGTVIKNLPKPLKSF